MSSNIFEVSSNDNNDCIVIIEDTKNEKKTENIVPKKISSNFWVYGTLEKSDSELSKILNGRSAICELVYRLSSRDSILDIQKYICDVLNGNVPIKCHNLITGKSRKERIQKNGCRYGLSCHNAINSPNAEHKHAHTLTQFITYNILNKLYRVVLNKEDLDASISDNKVYHVLPEGLYAVPRTEIDEDKLYQILSRKIPAFFAGKTSWTRIGNNNSVKWCNNPICYNYVKDHFCPNKHDEDTSFISILTRLLVKIIVRTGKKTKREVVQKNEKHTVTTMETGENINKFSALESD